MSSPDSVVNWGAAAAYPILPWHVPVVERLAAQHRAGRLGHALLVSGEIGTGVSQFMFNIAAGLLCKGPEGLLACGQCRSCQLLAAGGHPDAKYLVPEDAKVIKVDQVRAAINFANSTAQQGGYRIIMIAPAEALNTSGANALLKVLEEPGDNTVLLLASYAPAALMATLRSRCQKLALPPPTVAEAGEWLQHHGVAINNDDTAYLSPLSAYHLQQTGEQNSRQKVQACFRQLREHTLDAGQFAKQLGGLDALLVADALYAACAQVLQTEQLPAVFESIDSLSQWRRQLLAGASLNAELYLHSWAINLIKAPAV